MVMSESFVFHKKKSALTAQNNTDGMAYVYSRIIINVTEKQGEILTLSPSSRSDCLWLLSSTHEFIFMGRHNLEPVTCLNKISSKSIKRDIRVMKLRVMHSLHYSCSYIISYRAVETQNKNTAQSSLELDHNLNTSLSNGDSLINFIL